MIPGAAPNLLSGSFGVAAEGCFLVIISSSDKSNLGGSVWLRFSITQHARDAELLRSFIPYLGCGRYSHSQVNPEVILK